MKISFSKHQGFTLLELIISCAIVLVLIVGVYSLSLGANRNTNNSEVKQKAVLYGQQIFEDFRSSDVTKTLTGSGPDYTLTLSDGIVLKGEDTYVISDYDLGKGYKADITLARNSSTIGSGQTPVGTPSDYKYTINLKKSELRAIWMGDERDSEDWRNIKIDSDNPAEIFVKVTISGTCKTITVNGKNGEEFSKDFDIKSDEDKKKEIKLSINCSEYKFNKPEDKNKDQGFEVVVSNHDKVPINICLQKSNTINAGVISKLGKYRLYNNRASNETLSNMGNLYDITVKVKKDSELLFNGEISQNLKIQDNSSKASLSDD